MIWRESDDSTSMLPLDLKLKKLLGVVLFRAPSAIFTSAERSIPDSPYLYRSPLSLEEYLPSHHAYATVDDCNDIQFIVVDYRNPSPGGLAPSHRNGVHAASVDVHIIVAKLSDGDSPSPICDIVIVIINIIIIFLFR